MTPELTESINAATVSIALSNKARLSGSIIQAGMKSIEALRWERSSGLALNPEEKDFGPEAIASQWQALDDFTRPEYPDGPLPAEKMGALTQGLLGYRCHSDIRFDGQVVIITGAASGYVIAAVLPNIIL